MFVWVSLSETVHLTNPREEESVWKEGADVLLYENVQQEAEA